MHSYTNGMDELEGTQTTQSDEQRNRAADQRDVPPHPERSRLTGG